MTKKSKQPKHKKSLTTTPSHADKLFDLMGHQIFQGDYTGAIANGERLLRYLPQYAPLRADVLGQLGVAHGMLQNYAESYQAFTRTGPPKIIGMSDPFKNSKTKQSMTFLLEG